MENRSNLLLPDRIGGPFANSKPANCSSSNCLPSRSTCTTTTGHFEEQDGEWPLVARYRSSLDSHRLSRVAVFARRPAVVPCALRFDLREKDGHQEGWRQPPPQRARGAVKKQKRRVARRDFRESAGASTESPAP